jgi:hypothetical protein
LQENFSLGAAELSGTTIPEHSHTQIAALAAQVSATEKQRVESLRQAQRRGRISGKGTALIKQARGRHVPSTQKRIAARQQRAYFRRCQHRAGGLGRSIWR